MLKISGYANTSSGKPTITGPAQVGMTLTADTDAISDPDGLTGATFTYQWTIYGSPISGATDSTYTLAQGDIQSELRVVVDYTDDASNAESVTSDASNPVVPAAALNCDAPGTIWCTVLTAGHSLKSDGDVDAAGYSAGNYGSLEDATFTHDGVEYTVTEFIGGGNLDLYIETTPSLLPGNTLVVHVQRVVGEVDLPFAEATLSDGEWSFSGALNTSDSLGDTFTDVPLLHAPRNRDQVVPEPTDVGTEIAVRLSMVSEDLGETLVSNIEQAVHSIYDLDSRDIAQGFTTGANAGGYTLTAVSVSLGFGFGQTFGAASLHKDDPTNAAVATLDPPVDVPSEGGVTLRAPAGTILDPDSTYYVVLDGGGADLRNTIFSAEDAVGLSDWAILDVAHARNHSSTGAFAEVTSAGPLLISVFGHVNPNPDVLVSNVGRTTVGTLSLSARTTWPRAS